MLDGEEDVAMWLLLKEWFGGKMAFYFSFFVMRFFLGRQRAVVEGAATLQKLEDAQRTDRLNNRTNEGTTDQQNDQTTQSLLFKVQDHFIYI